MSESTVPQPLTPPGAASPLVQAPAHAAPARGRLHTLYRFLSRDTAGFLGVSLFVLIVLTAIFAPLLAPHDPIDQNLSAAKQPPAWNMGGTWEYPLGTDNL